MHQIIDAEYSDFFRVAYEDMTSLEKHEFLTEMIINAVLKSTPKKKK